MNDANSVRVGLVLPEAYYGEEEWRNAEPALRYLDEAARQGAQIVCFPEGYPGPATGPLDSPRWPFQPLEALAARARELGVYVLAGDVTVAPEVVGAHRLNLRLLGPDGGILATYVRVQPDTPPLNAYLYDGKAHLLPGREFAVVPTPWARLGLEICSELFVPEISRILMLRGAEIIVAPVHGLHSEAALELTDTWRCVARARAAENLCFVLVTQNLFLAPGFDYRTHVAGGAFVAGPERMEAASEKEGVLAVTLDLDRLRWLRSRNYDEENLGPPSRDARPLGCRPGQIWERDPALFRELAEPHRYSFNYGYAREGLDAWEKEYEWIYEGRYREIRDRRGAFRFTR